MLRFAMMSGAIAGAVGAVRGLGRSSARQEAEADPAIRDAGTASMDHPPTDWDMTDETCDESFPASDPPGNY